MKRITLIVSVFIFTILSANVAYNVAYSEKDKPEKASFVSDELIVKFKMGFDSSSLDFQKLGVTSSKRILKRTYKFCEKYGLDRLHLIKTQGIDVYDLIMELQRNPIIEYAEPNYIVSTCENIPNDTYFDALYGLSNTGQTRGTPDADIDAPEAWDIVTGTEDVIIAVIDTGVDYTHVDLTPNIWFNLPEEIGTDGIDDDGNGFVDDTMGWDFCNNDNDPVDDNGHGTHCAGTIGAVGNNGAGIVGVNWKVRIMPLKFLGADGFGTTADAILAISYATQMGAHIMSNSWGGGGYSQALEDAISAANDAGILFVAAAGNSDTDNDVYPHYPSSYDVPNVVAVAATDHDDQKADVSSYGIDSVDLGAPGVDIFSTVPTGSCSHCNTSGYTYLSGTSMATPHVSGAAGLVKDKFPGLDSNGMKLRLLGTVDPNPALDGIILTGGRLNVFNALRAETDPPYPVENLEATNPTINSLTLTWGASADDDGEKLALYDVRYSVSPITDANWADLIQAAGEPKPQDPGTLESFVVTGLSHSTTYYFAMRVYDSVGNVSALSNVISASTAEAITIFEDDMESLDCEFRWSHESLWHLEPRRFNSGSRAWAYNTGSPHYNYETGGPNCGGLTSRAIDLSGYNSAILTFHYWYETENDIHKWDERWIQLGLDGYFTNVAQLYGDPMYVWNEYTIDLSPYLGNPNVQVRFYFDSTDDIQNQYEGWYIDDVEVIGSLGEGGSPPEPPVADAGGPYPDHSVCEEIMLNGSGSYDDEGIVSYLWDFGDNSSPEEGQVVSHTYNTTGVFTVHLTVTDISGLIGVDSTAVTIGRGANFVDITKAEYSATKEQLKVEAVSSMGGCARLEVANYGSMTYDDKRDIYKLSRRAENNPGVVTVECGPDLSETETVTEKGAGRGKKMR